MTSNQQPATPRRFALSKRSAITQSKVIHVLSERHLTALCGVRVRSPFDEITDTDKLCRACVAKGA